MRKVLLIPFMFLVGCNHVPTVSLDEDNDYYVTLVTGIDGKLEIINEGKINYQVRNNTARGVWHEFSTHFEGESDSLYNLKDESEQLILHKAVSDVLQTPFTIDLKDKKSDFANEEKQLSVALETLKKTSDITNYHAVIPTVDYIQSMLKDSSGMLVMFNLPQTLHQEKKLSSLFNIPNITIKLEKMNDKYKYYSLRSSSEDQDKLQGTLTVKVKNNQVETVVLYHDINSRKYINGRSLLLVSRGYVEKNKENKENNKMSIGKYISLLRRYSNFIEQTGLYNPMELFPEMRLQDETTFPWSGMILQQENDEILLYVPLNASQYKYYSSSDITQNLKLKNITAWDEHGKPINESLEFKVIKTNPLWKDYAADKSYGITMTLQLSQVGKSTPLPKLGAIDADIDWQYEQIVGKKEIVLDSKKTVTTDIADMGKITVSPGAPGEWNLSSDSESYYKNKRLDIYTDKKIISHTLQANKVISWFDGDEKERWVLASLTPYAGLYESIKTSDLQTPPTLIFPEKKLLSGTVKLHWYSPAELLKNGTKGAMPLQFSKDLFIPKENIDSIILEKGFAEIEKDKQRHPDYYNKRIDISFPLYSVCNLTTDATDLRWFKTGSGESNRVWDLKTTNNETIKAPRKVNAALECRTGKWVAGPSIEPQVFVNVATLLPKGVTPSSVNSYQFFNQIRFINNEGESLAPVPQKLFLNSFDRIISLRASHEQLENAPLSQFVNKDGYLRFTTPVSHIERFEFDKDKIISHRWVVDIRK
ncbi:TPA: hypothetical protein ORM06_004232 [Klebsiella aerogenes]|nr:hypothetical protein [Klebsiella aerogenes]